MVDRKKVLLKNYCLYNVAQFRNEIPSWGSVNTHVYIHFLMPLLVSQNGVWVCVVVCLSASIQCVCFLYHCVCKYTLKMCVCVCMLCAPINQPTNQGKPSCVTTIRTRWPNSPCSFLRPVLRVQRCAKRASVLPCISVAIVHRCCVRKLYATPQSDKVG